MAVLEMWLRAAINFIVLHLLGIALMANPALGGAAGLQSVGNSCASDMDCDTNFCDLGICSAPWGQYGAECLPAPITAEVYRDAALNSCGAYICHEL